MPLFKRNAKEAQHLLDVANENPTGARPAEVVTKENAGEQARQARRNAAHHNSRVVAGGPDHLSTPLHQSRANASTHFAERIEEHSRNANTGEVLAHGTAYRAYQRVSHRETHDRDLIQQGINIATERIEQQQKDETQRKNEIDAAKQQGAAEERVRQAQQDAENALVEGIAYGAAKVGYDLGENSANRARFDRRNGR